MNISIMRLVWVVIPILLIGTLGILVNTVDAQCVDEFCTPSNNVAKQFYEIEEPYKIRQLILYDYDERGNQIEMTQYGKNGVLIKRVKSVYDDDNLIDNITYQRPNNYTTHITYNNLFGNNLLVTAYINSNNEITKKFITLTNDDGKIIKVQNTDSRGNVLVTKLNDYDRFGRLVEKKMFSDTSSTMWEKYEYDKDNNRIKLTTFHPNGIIFNAHIYEYENNKLISKIFDGVGASEEKYEYDNNGNLVVIKYYSILHDQLILSKLNAYDEDNNNIEIKFIKWSSHLLMGEMTKWEKINYDENGNAIDVKSLMNNGDLKYWRHNNYNENGNVIQQIVFDVPKKYKLQK